MKTKILEIKTTGGIYCVKNSKKSNGGYCHSSRNAQSNFFLSAQSTVLPHININKILKLLLHCHPEL